jgi:Ca-activated chloride channel family protein
LKLPALISLLCCSCVFVDAQYYFTGEVQDLHGDKLQHVSIVIWSSHSVFQTGRSGEFEITSLHPDDSVTFIYQGYEQYSTVIRSSDFLQITLLRRAPPNYRREDRLRRVEGPSSIAFAGGSNGISFHNVARFLEMGSPVPAEAVRIEEMLDYFNLSYEPPDPPQAFHFSSALLSCPWNAANRLLLVNVSGRKADIERKPPANLVFLIDVSGSMDRPDKMPLIKAGIRPLLRNLRDFDTVSIIQYGSRLQVIAGIPGSARASIIPLIEQLRPDGPSPGEEGIKLAYSVAQHHFIPSGSNRIIFLTDGDIYSGQSSSGNLEEYVGQQSAAGITLSCLGVGLGDTSSPGLALLAQRGGGHFASIGDEQAGEQQLLKEFVGSEAAIAEHLSITADFDTALVSSYRLIGFENKASVAVDTVTTLEGCTAGSAQSFMAMFEITPKKDSIGIPVIARLKLHYRLPGQGVEKTMDYDCPNDFRRFEKATAGQKKAAFIALFGLKLKSSPATDKMSWSDLQKMAKQVFSDSDYMDREYLLLVAKARKIYESPVVSAVATHEQ